MHRIAAFIYWMHRVQLFEPFFFSLCRFFVSHTHNFMTWRFCICFMELQLQLIVFIHALFEVIFRQSPNFCCVFVLHCLRCIVASATVCFFVCECIHISHGFYLNYNTIRSKYGRHKLGFLMCANACESIVGYYFFLSLPFYSGYHFPDILVHIGLWFMQSSLRILLEPKQQPEQSTAEKRTIAIASNSRMMKKGLFEK